MMVNVERIALSVKRELYKRVVVGTILFEAETKIAIY